jgi:hypothetical protein
MVDMLQAGAAWLESQRLANLTTAAVYQRGGSGGTTVPVNVTWGQTGANVVDEQNVGLRTQIRDALIAVSELATLTPPKPISGDQIIMTGLPTYEVDETADGIWRYSDRYKLRFRIHLKQVTS